MREELERGNFSIIHSEETNPQDVAALFKEFFRDLPDPLLTRELYAPFLATRSEFNSMFSPYVSASRLHCYCGYCVSSSLIVLKLFSKFARVIYID